MDSLSIGDQFTLTIDSAAHGGEGVARHEGAVIFVPGALPGDTVRATLVEVKKRFARARIDDIVEPSPGRVAYRCPAAAAGAGCCDFSTASPELELEIKAKTVAEQLQRIGKLENLPEIEVIDLKPTVGWRTRFRLGVDSQGRAGMRATLSNDIVTGAVCAQAAAGVLDDVVAADARFTPGAELVVAVGSNGQRTVVESKKAARGRNVTRQTRKISGPATVEQQVGDTTFHLDPLGFWQAHVAAPAAYTDTVTEWLSSAQLPADAHVWDLYGGVGLFVPAIRTALSNATISSVELGAGAAKAGRAAVQDAKVEFVTGDVAKVVDKLPAAAAIVLDPPRKGAGAAVIHKLAESTPQAVVHVGCDPATMARDLAVWVEHRYSLRALRMFNAFPGTHHSETFAFLTRD